MELSRGLIWFKLMDFKTQIKKKFKLKVVGIYVELLPLIIIKYN